MTDIATAPQHPLPAALMMAVTIGAVALQLAGGFPDSAAFTAIASVVLLVVGVPHGSFDIALLRRASADRSPTGPVAILFALYLACALAMYLVWRIEPVLALAGFLVMAMAHFAEDWAECGSRIAAAGLAVAIVSAPALLHGGELGALFVVLTGRDAAAALVDMLALAAPIASPLAIIALVRLMQAGRAALAVSAGCSLAAMLLLPPVIGFALFFCLVHSPLQFRAHADALGLHGVRQWAGIVVPLSLGGLAVAGAVFLANGTASVATNLFASSFMALSILTAPHMLVPMIAARWLPRPAPAV